MELSWNDRRTRQFLTNVGLITTDGPYGPNVMAAEWTHHISYSPSLIAINVRGDDATAENIDHSKEFGVNLAAEDQNILCSIGDISFQTDWYNILQSKKYQHLNDQGCRDECRM